MRVERIELPGSGYGAKAAALTAYVQDNIEDQSVRRRPAALVCPGGGYAFCSDREGEPIALALLARGYQAFVLDYTVMGSIEAVPLLPAPQMDLARALALVRSRADGWHVDGARIGLIGCSAGAHLCATYAALARDDAFLARTGVSARPRLRRACLRGGLSAAARPGPGERRHAAHLPLAHVGGRDGSGAQRLSPCAVPRRARG